MIKIVESERHGDHTISNELRIEDETGKSSTGRRAGRGGTSRDTWEGLDDG